MKSNPFRSASLGQCLRKWLPVALLVPLLGYMLWSLRAQSGQLSALITWRSLPAFVAAAASLAVTQLLMACRQMLLLRHVGVQIPFRTIRQITFAGLFVNNVMPAGTGYDLARLVLLCEHGCQGRGLVGGLVLLDRVIALIGLSMLAFVGSTLLFVDSPNAVAYSAVGTLAFILLVPLPLIAIILALRHPKAFDLLMRLAWRLFFAETIQRLLVSMRQYSTKKRILFATLALAVVGLFFAILAIALIAYGLYDLRSFWNALLLSPLILFASSIPVTPANLGWTETVAETTWALFGLHGGMVIFLALRVVTMFVSLSGCVAYVNLRRQAVATAEDS